MALPAVRQMYRRVPRAYIRSPELKVLDLGVACHSTSTKVRDEGLSRPRTIIIGNSFRGAVEPKVLLVYIRRTAGSATIVMYT